VTATTVPPSTLPADHNAEIIELDTLGPEVYGTRFTLHDGTVVLVLPTGRSDAERERTIRHLLTAPRREAGHTPALNGEAVDWTLL